ncbi:MAG: sensor histidine kinase [Labilithrix sp.]|nr:sensor histidine kinase [Labilithrix sp.]
MDLAGFVSARQDEIVKKWAERVHGTLHPAVLPRLELVDHVPTFLAEIVEALQRHEGPETSETAARHGVQRFALGFSLGAVVREYGALRDCIVEEAAAAGVVITTAARETLLECTFTGIAEAVTEYQKQRDAELQRQMNEHFAFVAHELRNPLNAALTATTLLKDRGELDVRLVAFALRGLGRMHDLIDRTLRIARIGAVVEARLEPTTMRALLEAAKADASPEADTKRVDLRLHATNDDHVSVDVRLLHSALTNLVRNAVKFTPPGGHVDIRGSVAERRAKIEVEDGCGGWPEGRIEKAFAPFVQVGDDRSGFGLGLAIAKQAVDAHGGAIGVRNLPGKGCVVFLDVPA